MYYRHYDFKSQLFSNSILYNWGTSKTRGWRTANYALSYGHHSYPTVSLYDNSGDVKRVAVANATQTGVYIALSDSASEITILFHAIGW